MKKLILILLLNVITFASTLPSTSVVKIFTAKSYYDYNYPWESPKILNYTGSGAIIEGNKILTSAHVVSGGKFIEVLKENDSKKYIARLKYISNQVDLAILEIEDKTFFNGTVPLKLSEDVKNRDSVMVLGYPLGGNTISITQGIVSRIENISYVWSGFATLAIQIDAAINSGNSGGPAIDKNGNLIGIAMQGLKNSNNIAYIVPSIIINTFFEDIKDGKVDGMQFSKTRVKSLENDSMKEYFGIKDNKGILVVSVDYEDSELKVNDVILSINGKDIANDGTIASKYGRVSFSLELDTKQLGDIVVYDIIRNKQELKVNYKVKYSKPLINKEFDEKPRYLILGGLVFSPATKNYLTEINPKAVDMLFYKQEKNEQVNEPVMWLQTIFPHKINRSYSSGAYTVSKVNGIKIKNFKHFVEVIDNIKDEYIIIDFLEKTQVVLKTKDAKDSFSEIKAIYGLKSDRNIE